jgi:hypothetical protein
MSCPAPHAACSRDQALLLQHQRMILPPQVPARPDALQQVGLLQLGHGPGHQQDLTRHPCQHLRCGQLRHGGWRRLGLERHPLRRPLRVCVPGALPLLRHPALLHHLEQLQLPVLPLQPDLRQGGAGVQQGRWPPGRLQVRLRAEGGGEGGGLAGCTRALQPVGSDRLGPGPGRAAQSDTPITLRSGTSATATCFRTTRRSTGWASRPTSPRSPLPAQSTST